MTHKLDFSFIINDNENAAREAFDRGDYIQAFLLIHTLIESLLRLFLKETDEEVKVSTLIKKYNKFLDEQKYPVKTLVKELAEFNRRRNRMVHQLWHKGYSYTNRQSKPAANAALILYGLSIEFLETFYPEITKTGFQYT
ncbi:MAG: hypothetical protein HY753_09460 [Nitrospirae bacterium]|nr:hypothetical protein [Nitrospirota bacterium]